MPRYDPVPVDRQVASARSVESAGLAPPPKAHRRVTREQFNTKIRPELRGRLDRFVVANESTMQATVEAALTEYLDRRGWEPDS